MTLSELSDVLAGRGLIERSQPLHIDPGLPGAVSPWFLQIVMGFCAWVAGILLVAFVGIGLASHGTDSGLFLGIGLCGCLIAMVIYRSIDNSVFGSQFALAMSCAGQFSIVAGIAGLNGPHVALWGMMALEIILTVVMANSLHRLLSALGAVFAWALATHDLFFHDLPGINISWGAQPTATYQLSFVSVLLWLMVWTPVAFLAWWLARNEALWMSKGGETAMRPVTHGVIASLSVAPLATHPATFWMALGLGSTRDLTDGSLSATALWPLLALLLSLLGMALAFLLRHRPLIGTAILFGLLEVSAFYYVLGASLLVKSIAMIVLGILLLAGGRTFAREAA